nr:alcohol dehydrogenase catalytic domain-containing protein [Afifella marina]
MCPSGASTVKALVYYGSGKISWEDKPLPKIEHPADVIVRISKTTLCGTDLAILRGGVPTVQPGRTIGHEATGYITEVGPAVQDFKVGDHVIIPCNTSCGRCDPCRRGLHSSCERGGWLLGNTIDGVQAEYARIPLADSSLFRIPDGVDEEAALMLADILPTGLEVGVKRAEVSLGDALVVIGAGPVGLATILAAEFYSPARIIAIDLDDNRLAKALEIGATNIINNKDGKAREKVMALTEGRGADAVIEVIGNPATFQLAQEILAAGGRMANIGIFHKSTELHSETLWTHNITLRMGVVDNSTVPVLLKMVQAGRLDPTSLVSHHFHINEILDAYEIFKNAAEEEAIKVVLSTDAAKKAGSGVSNDNEFIRQIVGRVLASL